MRKKICFIASSGGHFEQLMMLKPIMNKYESFIVTEKTSYMITEKDIKYFLEQINRKEKLWLIKMIKNFNRSLKIFVKEKPDFIISTGVLSTIPMCLIGKIFRKKIIYLESFAKIHDATLTGKLLYKFADQFYVQWEDMMDIYPNSIYKGGIY
ncbi:PssD/Cps14F family polysaccharide biosynthesis glycosyltransferase [Clostridium perfringens]|uniref:PssD/Cps14F family polysaccharide biosynthesis glycosyltransferase n=1 Tax=Clostridium perfringens TaxID=1502 RepID=UPI001FABA8DB|nr:PssD/Cps14F family polysaccharide biosynthesis glycosyltransferase [Clostridium perfringens]